MVCHPPQVAELGGDWGAGDNDAETPRRQDEPSWPAHRRNPSRFQWWRNHTNSSAVTATTVMYTRPVNPQCRFLHARATPTASAAATAAPTRPTARADLARGLMPRSRSARPTV